MEDDIRPAAIYDSRLTEGSLSSSPPPSNPPILHPSILYPLSSILAAGLFLASLALYIATLAPSVATLFDDSLEFQLVTYRLGIAHPTGYPLYTLLGKLFTFLPIGNVAYRVNLLSAVFGAATVAALYLFILQILHPPALPAPTVGQVSQVGSNPPFFHSSILPPFPSWPLHLGATIGALLLAMSATFWQMATVAEVYTLNAFFVVGLLLAATWPGLNTPRRWVLVAFMAGLGLTHHRTTLLLFPALLAYLLSSRDTVSLGRKGIIRAIGVSAVAGLLPLLLYLYLPWRGSQGSLDGTYQNNWAGFWQQVSASGYSLFIFGNPFGQERTPAFYGQLFQRQFYTLLPGVIGLGYLVWARQWRSLLLTGLAFLTYGLFNLFYSVSDIEVFFIPSFLLWAAWSGVGAAFLFGATARIRTGRWAAVAGLGLIFAAIGFILLLANQADLSRRYTWQVHDYGLDMLQQPLPAGRSAIVGILGEITLVRYFQQTDNRRPDIQTIAADKETDRLAVVEKLLAEGKSVYLTREAAMLPGAPERWSLNAVGPLTRIDPEPVTIPPPLDYPVQQAVTPELTLLGYSLARPSFTGSGPAPLRITAVWQARSSPGSDLKVSARLLDPAGQPVAVTDVVPVHFAYPTRAWRPGEIVADVYDLALPVDLPAGQYTPLLIWYDPAQNAAEVGRIELAPVRPGR